ncbi:capsular polysaccharide export protein [Sulfuriferula plumbiphila]|uniref:Capsular polysaccharide export protein n=1 Tax=Sulfuriferula plumbiphila TaxID=171865 RepID=A0A512L6H5_9PROT|nr:capsular biosynthesis protein [Sulfuriferula plumbiphila]BBP04813.1 capsular polysaccharide export protein [Sulfuriferula plumbiphila]GEP30086.1 capsular polysaccharide export protein [Sulfuriferula plumbiphila]
MNFNGGDAAYWGLRAAWSYRGSVDGLCDYLAKKYHRFGITDQILFGDSRPIHRPAVNLAEKCGIRTHVFEEGYFRPYWVTLEREGVNGHSLLPRDPDWFWQVGEHLPDYGDGEPFASPFWLRAAYDVGYHVASASNPVLYPGYRIHAPVHAAVEYAGYVRRFTKLRFVRGRDRARVNALVSGSTPYFLLPLQLNSDAQIRDHSRFEDMAGLMEYVMESFARHTPGDVRLVIKNHPLDMGLVNYPRIIAQLERRFSLAGRIDYLESGDLMGLIQHARGVVTVNSTVGALSVGLGCPTIGLSDSIYNLPGLTFQGHLDEFWRDGVKPDAELFRRFRNTVIHTTQVNGGFYSRQGIALAVANCRRMLEPEHLPLEELL